VHPSLKKICGRTIVKIHEGALRFPEVEG